jgi:hypothetical protein
LSQFIVEYPQALSTEFCDHLINKFEHFNDKRPGRTGAGVDLSKKDSLDCYISQSPEWQTECNQLSHAILKAATLYAQQFPFLLTGAISPQFNDPQTGETRSILAEDIAKLGSAEVENMIKMIYTMDDINLQKYQKAKGGYHHWHSEHFPHPTDPAQKSLHRVLLWLVYLNDVEKGGETEFFYQNQKIKPKKGSLVLAPVNFTYTHRGCIPESNDKYVLASWLMYKPANQLYPGGPKK